MRKESKVNQTVKKKLPMTLNKLCVHSSTVLEQRNHNIINGKYIDDEIQTDCTPNESLRR